jgi:hypothetical protein
MKNLVFVGGRGAVNVVFLRALKQSGPVWFLSGTFGGSATRVSTIPSGKAILFSLMNAECDYTAKPNLKTESQLLACAKSENDGITGLDATVDGVKTPGLSNFRVQSPLFNLTYILIISTELQSGQHKEFQMVTGLC